MRRAEGKLAVLMPGLGAVATTVIAGVHAVRRGLGKPIGSFTQMGRLDGSSVSERLGLAKLDQLEFAAWDIFPVNAYESAVHAGVLERQLLETLKEPLSAIAPMPAVFDANFVRKLDGPHVKRGASKRDLAEALRADIRAFLASSGSVRAVMVWCGSTEVYSPEALVHASVRAFEAGLAANDPAISPAQIYAYAAIKERVPFANGSPHNSVQLPALQELARELLVPLAGSDYKTGQTFMKTAIAPALRDRHLGVSGWFSVNILGNRDGEVLDDPEACKTKELAKTGVLERLLDADVHPDLYRDLCHLVRINYYPPKGDNKEGWDNVDLFGWLGYPMQLKINFLCRDSILAAPLVLDLALLLDLAARAGRGGIQDWLAYYFKAPLADSGPIEHDLSVQTRRLVEALRGFAAL